ncbi:rhodanese-like domain-containing protein [Paracrocinitomix mangrovi]|uniref:rhodanese-like domain-containing protein n=1 Tax=Paracrocinitomix mangrovi TaxID=2862509 RepID=UPI001C8D3E13|nr:rhodanese-like domain-containing protein [Paracrocinitomix mangrovi]UKN00173.1 rhodanese-like domain-containing protein [Paracrocinitomix mangrovi]
MNVEEITPQEAIEAVKNGSFFVDVREPYEVDEVSYGIEYVNIPLGEIQVRINEFPKDKNIIVGCRSGGRSMNACMFLKMQGFDNVTNLQGGILGWMDNGCPTG